MKMSVLSSSIGAKVTANQLALRVPFAGFQSTCDLAGSRDVKGFGHYHVLIDKSLPPLNHSCAVVRGINDNARRSMGPPARTQRQGRPRPRAALSRSRRPARGPIDSPAWSLVMSRLE
jgi:hypothetical protein